MSTSKAEQTTPLAGSRGFAPSGPIDLSALQSLGGGAAPLDSDFMFDIIELFLELGPQIHQDAVDAVSDGDGGSLSRACHKLKSQAGYFGAHRLVHVCVRLEEIGLAGDIPRAEVEIANLEDELDRVNAALQPHRRAP